MPLIWAKQTPRVRFWRILGHGGPRMVEHGAEYHQFHQGEVDPEEAYRGEELPPEEHSEAAFRSFRRSITATPAVMRLTK